MAPSPSDCQFLDSTSRLFSFLDLTNQEHHHPQNMDDIDLDQIMEVPDTPDRLVRRTNRDQVLAKEITRSSVDDSDNCYLLADGSPSQARNCSRPTHTNRSILNNRRLPSRRLGDPSFRNERDQMNRGTIVLSDSPDIIPKGCRSSKRTLSDQSFKEPAAVFSSLPHGHGGNGDKVTLGRGSTADILSSDPINQDKNMMKTTPRNSFIRDTGKATCTEIPSKGIKKGLIRCSTRGTSNLSIASDNMFGEKRKIDGKTHIPPSEILNHGKGILFSCNSISDGDQTTVKSSTSTRNTGKKLVRNGCISPNNIAMANHTPEIHPHSSNGGQCDKRVTSNDRIPQKMHNTASNFKENQSIKADKVKGKGVMVDPPDAKFCDAKTLHFSGSSLNSVEEGSGIRDFSKDNVRCSKELDGWRSTRNRAGVTSSESYEVRHLSAGSSGFDSLIDEENRTRIGTTESRPRIDVLDVTEAFQDKPANSAQASSTITQLIENGRHGRGNKLTKRQRKQSSIRNSTGDCSTSDFDDSELSYRWSSRQPATSRSTRNQDPRPNAISTPIIEIDEFSPEIRCRNSEGTSRIVDGDSDARSRQLEADEMLARELQEQFYHELPQVGGLEDDASIARRLQQQDTLRLSLGGSRRANSRGSSTSDLYRQYSSETFPNSLSRTSSLARGSFHRRTARLRNNHRQSPTVPASRGSRPRFSRNMDIDTRMHILEALEAAVSDRGTMSVVDQFLQVQRDFNENDYEMLLALDENNHQHVGASVNQINALPQSTVQTENLEEACAICLETPSVGDTIRHLPCFHKFHKDCIDQWLGRSTSCPVCKSGIS